VSAALQTSQLEVAGAAAAAASSLRGRFGSSGVPDSDRTGLADPLEDRGLAGGACGVFGR